MLQRYIGKAVHELHFLRSSGQHVFQAAGEQMHALHCMVQQQSQAAKAPEETSEQSVLSDHLVGQRSCLQGPLAAQQPEPKPPLLQHVPAGGVAQITLPGSQPLHEQYLQQHLQRICPEQPNIGVLRRHAQHPLNNSRISSSDGLRSSSPVDLTADSTAAAAMQSQPHPEDAFSVTSLQQQYHLTLESLHMGRSRNIAQLAQMFDPHAVLAGPDKGAAILEALMFGAAKLGDMQLLAQLLRCCEAAQIPLSTTGHTAVLHGLAHSGLASRAKHWLEEEVPQQMVTPSMLRAVVQPLLQQGHVQSAGDILQWAGTRLQPGTPAGAGNIISNSMTSSSLPDIECAAGSDPLSVQDHLQTLLCLQLMVAGAKGNVAAVQAEWASMQQQQQDLIHQLQQSGSFRSPYHHPHLLGVATWASYVSALCKARKANQNQIVTLQPVIRRAVCGLADVYHTAAWNRWDKVVAAKGSMHQQQQQQQQDIDQPEASSAAAIYKWQHQLRHLRRITWQEQSSNLSGSSWQQLDPAAVLPQEVSSVVHRVERDALSRALGAAMHVAAEELDREWMSDLLKTGALLKAMPVEWGFDALLNFKLWGGETPEAMEELIGEVMGWGVKPSLAHFEHLAEAYAVHGKLGSAVAVLDRIYAAGHTPLLRTYNRLLHGLATRGDIKEANCVYLRLKMQGLVPDAQTMRGLFKCVRMYGIHVRVESARRLAQLKPGDRKERGVVLSQRSGLFAAAYGQLVEWQGELVAAGLKHSDASMHQLLAALERLGAVEDCVQLAKLHEEMKPGSYSAHRFALQAVGRRRYVEAASHSATLAARVTAGDRLSREDYKALIASQFWLTRNHQQLLQTVAAMRAAGHELDQSVLLQVLHVYCHHDMWSEALRLLDDVAAGKVGVGTLFLGANGNSTNSGSKHKTTRQQYNGSEDDPGLMPMARGSAAAQWPRSYQPVRHSAGTTEQDALWHIVLRKLWEQRASDGLLNEFLQRMSPGQLQRFKILYNLQQALEGGYTMQPLDDWQVPADSRQQEDISILAADSEAASVKEVLAPVAASADMSS